MHQKAVAPSAGAGHDGAAAALSSNPLFGSVNKEQMDILVNNMKRQQVGRGEALINQGEADGAHFYIVLSGAFDVYLDQVWAFGHAPTPLQPC